MRYSLTFLVTITIVSSFNFVSTLDSHYDDYVDFTDMSSYRHNSQINIPSNYKADGKEVNKTLNSMFLKYLKRQVASIVEQLHFEKHFFGPRESLTIDLQAEISYEDLEILRNFILRTEESDERTFRTLGQIDEVLSNLFRIVEPEKSPGILERLSSYALSFSSLFTSHKFWLVSVFLLVISYTTLVLLTKIIFSRNWRAKIYSFMAIVFLLSCVWSFVALYEKAKAENFARLSQMKSRPLDCQYEDLSTWDSISYYVRVNIFKYQDQCSQYYSLLTEPLFSVHPLAAFSDSVSILFFHPMEYIGGKLGLFLGGFLSGISWILQPLVLVLLFIFVFFTLCGISIRTPFMSIESGRSNRNREIPPAEGAPAVLPKSSDTIMEKPSGIVKISTKDASTDMSDFSKFLKGEFQGQFRQPRPEPRENEEKTYFQTFLGLLFKLCSGGFFLLDFLLRRVPYGVHFEEDRRNCVNVSRVNVSEEERRRRTDDDNEENTRRDQEQRINEEFQRTRQGFSEQRRETGFSQDDVWFVRPEILVPNIRRRSEGTSGSIKEIRRESPGESREFLIKRTPPIKPKRKLSCNSESLNVPFDLAPSPSAQPPMDWNPQPSTSTSTANQNLDVHMRNRKLSETVKILTLPNDNKDSLCEESKLYNS